MVEPSLTDRSRAETLVRQARAGPFKWVEYVAIIPFGIILAAVIADQLRNYMPLDLHRITQAYYIALAIGVPVCLIFGLRKLKSKYYKELEVIFAELFHEGLDEEKVRASVGHTFMYIGLPVRPAVKEERRKLLTKFRIFLVIVLTGLGIYFSVEGAGSETVIQQFIIGFFGGVFGLVAGVLIAWAPGIVFRILRQIM